MNLIYAQRCAEKLINWLMPFCEKIQVAGSIRRERQTVGDVDLVVIPKLRTEKDLLGTITGHQNLVADEVRRRAAEERWTILKDGPAYLVWMARTVQVDIWFATRATWGTVLMCRTGSKEHNIWLASRAGEMGGHWNPHHGLTIGQTTASETEESIYQLAGVPFIEPGRREAGQLP